MPQVITKNQIGQFIGAQLEPTDWFKVTQDQIDAFADCTLDKQFIHVNPEAAASTPFGSTIAHGFLTLSMLSYFAESFNVLISGITMGINKGFNRVRFVAPVRVGSQIRCHAKILEITEKKPGQFDFITEVSVEILDEEKPALVAEWLSVQVVS